MSRPYETTRVSVVAAGVAAAMGMLMAEAASAQSDPTVDVDVADCVTIESPAERFRCYESRVDAALREQGGEQALPPAPAETFGLRPPPPADEKERDAEELLGTIAALRQTVPNSYLITLENGQVWRQMRPQRYPLQIGHEVRIYPTRWGNSYRMTAVELNGFIQVERIQ